MTKNVLRRSRRGARRARPLVVRLLIASALTGAAGRAQAQGQAHGSVRAGYGGVGTLPNVGALNLRRPSQNVGAVGSQRLGAATSASVRPPLFGQAPVRPFEAQSLTQSGSYGTSPYLSRALSATAMGDRTNLAKTGGGISLSGFDLRGERASNLLSHPWGGGSRSESAFAQRQAGRQFAGLRAGGGLSLSQSQPVDRYGMAFARGPAGMPVTLPSATPISGRPTADAPLMGEIEPVASGPMDMIGRAQRDAMHFQTRGVERFLLREDQIREARIDFDNVRLLLPDEPRAYVGSCLSAMRLGDRQQAYAVWKQCLRHFSERNATLTDLWFDLNAVSTEPERIRQLQERGVRICRDLRKDVQSIDVQGPHRPRHFALVAYLAWLSGDTNVAVEQARLAVEADRANDPIRQIAGIDLLYQRLREAKEAADAAATPKRS